MTTDTDNECLLYHHGVQLVMRCAHYDGRYVVLGTGNIHRYHVTYGSDGERGSITTGSDDLQAAEMAYEAFRSQWLMLV